MVIKCYNEHHPYILFIDIEFNKKDLVQFAGLLFKRIEDDDTYQLCGSCNQYITQTVCYPFSQYTNITNNFLEGNGITIKDLKSILFDDFLSNVPLEQLVVVSHGLRNDRSVLIENGINLSTYTDSVGVQHSIAGYCTFNNAKRILNRDFDLSLGDITEECGYYLHHAHNAFNDVWAEVAVFTYLKKIEAQELQGE
jgi:hypothetical protein